jgi:hypothetical protein
MDSPIPPQHRRHAGSDGHTYDVVLAPIEGPHGVDPTHLALVFTREWDAAVLTVEVPPENHLYWLTGSDLEELLARAT